ncbi:MAG: peptidoglycan-associated lipoprotein Pal [Thermoanaerobaculia bacterium]|nr:peptidoglycan-associated lipoprotein Pal [Thermoanaerobaculia bacterium]
MSRKGMIVFAVLMLGVALVTTACPKKKAKQADDMEIESTPVEVDTEEVTTASTPTTAEDEKPEGLPEDLPALNEEIRQQGLIGDIFFDYDEYSLRAEARDRLAKNAEFMSEHPELLFTIEGHCDERGTNEYNLALGDRRANAAKDYLVSLGVDGDRLRTVSYGEERPFCEQDNESCYQLNRRAHFVVTGRADMG